MAASGYGDADLTIVADSGADQEVAGNSTVRRFKSSSGESPITPITPATAATIGSPLSQYATPTSQTQADNAGPASPSSGPGMMTAAAAGGNVVGEAHGGGTPELTRMSAVFLVVKELMKRSTFTIRAIAGLHFTFPLETIEQNRIAKITRK